jgi:hypothetical protein
LNPNQSKRLIVVGFVVITLITVSSVWVAGLLFNPTSYGQNFLSQLLERNEDAALEYLTPEFRDVVRNNCPESSVTECFWLEVDATWGSVVGMQFVRRDPTNTSELFHLSWSGLESPLSIVLHTRQVDGSYLVDGWRGFVVGADASVEDALLLGLREDNALVAPDVESE